MDKASGAEHNLRTVDIPAGAVRLEGELGLPPGAVGVVAFAHGSGSSRHSPRNQFVAQALRKAGVGTLLMDLLTAQEERIDAATGKLRFDIELLTGRLMAAADFLSRDAQTLKLPLGLFGASTGAAAALLAASRRKHQVAAVVSRGGRPDLAGEALRNVRAPTLLIVGAEDYSVVDLNRQAMTMLRCERRLVLAPGATHLFEEEGALEQVAQHAAEWFTTYLPRAITT
jgi:alpha-beta hydrolase superfamily lysophospholipase